MGQINMGNDIIMAGLESPRGGVKRLREGRLSLEQ